LPTVAAFSTDDETVLAATYYNKTAGERLTDAGLFGWVMLARDKYGRYQVFDQGWPYITGRAANNALTAKLRGLEGKEHPEVPMLPNSKRGVDLFSSLDGVTNLNPKFVNLRDGRHASAARELLTEIGRWHIDQDGNFVKDFQTAGFDSRIWELYLFATFKSLDFDLDTSHVAPDFNIARNGERLFVEATTANPTGNVQHSIIGVPPPPPENLRKYNEAEMVLKFGSPLESKIKKSYWDLPHVQGHCFAIAIADFHAPASMTWSQSALMTYLYGLGAESFEVDGGLRWREKPLESHTVGNKTIPSNFFAQDRHKHVSAIIFSNAGTQAKFNRMGVQAGFGDDAVQLVRAGGLHVPGDLAYEPEAFVVNVEDPAYSEDWDDELDIFHNPNAIHPMSDEMFPTAANYRVIDGEVRWDSPRRPVLFSRTRSLVFPFRGPEDVQKSKSTAHSPEGEG